MNEQEPEKFDRLSVQNELSRELQLVIAKFRKIGVTYADVLGCLEMSKAAMTRECLDVLETQAIQEAYAEHKEVEDAEPMSDYDIVNPEEPEETDTEYFDQQ